MHRQINYKQSFRIVRGIRPLNAPYRMQKMYNHGFTIPQHSLDSLDEQVNTITRSMILPNEPLVHPISSVYLRTHSRTPMVLLLGNHSSGKSSFINSLLGSSVQETGVAPTDDGFTAIIRGDTNITEDGQTAVSNPKYGFGELRSFGDAFLSHFKVKTRKLSQDSSESVLPHNIMLIDSPGMIDTPQKLKTVHSRTPDSSLSEHDRGYNFNAVVQWLGRRCDLILLLFDPSNPGTTGETLDILTHSLVGLEHKFIILFNKIDMFHHMNDFARCYGTLCWNLAKVLSYKDLPRIYTSFTESTKKSTETACTRIQSSRTEIIKDIYSAPIRRIDNLISELDESSRSLYILCFSINHLKNQHRALRIIQVTFAIAAGIFIPGISFGLLYFFGIEPVSLIASILFGICGTGLAFYGNLMLCNSWKPRISSIESEIIRQGIYKRIPEWKSIWEKLQQKLFQYIDPNLKSLSALPRTKRGILQSILSIIEFQVPELRRKAHALKLRGKID